jgi:hypothetical protein
MLRICQPHQQDISCLSSPCDIGIKLDNVQTLWNFAILIFAKITGRAKIGLISPENGLFCDFWTFLVYLYSTIGDSPIQRDLN